MVEPADLWDRDNLSSLCLLHRSGNRCVLGQTEVRSAPLVVLEVPSEDPPRVVFTKHDDMVEALASVLSRLRLTALSDAQHGVFTTGTSPISWGSVS